jgi:four helix bundle protein
LSIAFISIITIKKNKNMGVKSFKETTVYKKSFLQAMEIFEISKSFPKEEKYSLTDQVRRSSRSVCANMAEAYRKKMYPKNFISKLTDSDAENSETNVWIDFALSCGYINQELQQKLSNQNDEIGRLLHHMINNPDKY